MRCLTCDYSLANLPEDRCPECGRAFDPQDSSTFSTGQDHRRRAIRWALVVGGVGYLLVFAAQLLIDPAEGLVVLALTSIPLPLILAGMAYAVLE